MKTILAALVLILTISGSLFAALPGGFKHYWAYIRVYDQNGIPLSGIQVKLYVQTWYGNPLDPHAYSTTKFGVTDAGGYANLEIIIDPEFVEELVLMEASMIDTVISSQYTSTTTMAAIWPRFDVGFDNDDNEVVDVWEMSLAQKFCPMLRIPNDDSRMGSDPLRPQPVQILTRDYDGDLDSDDVFAEVWRYYLHDTNDPHPIIPEAEYYELIGCFPMNSISVTYFNSTVSFDYSTLYPDGTWLTPGADGRFERIDYPSGSLEFWTQNRSYKSFLDGNWYSEVDTRKPYIIPHFDWAANAGYEEHNDSWYSEWKLRYDNPSSYGLNTSLVRDGTVYAEIGQENDETYIKYRLFYPFNAAPNRHEGDWPAITIYLSNTNPNNATANDIIRVKFNYHGDSTTRTDWVSFENPPSGLTVDELKNLWFAEDGNSGSASPPGVDVFAYKFYAFTDASGSQTHPVSFAGGFIDEFGVEGYGSHAQYPNPGIWVRDKPTFRIEEYVTGPWTGIKFNSF